MGLVFLTGFIYFLAKKKFNKGMIGPMIILFILGGVQGFIGWIMVKSGLVPEKYFVGHVELTTHFIAALGLLCYTLWFALSLVVKKEQQIVHPSGKNYLLLILALLFIQLVYGGFMAGMRAAITAPTWPDINGHFLPPSFNELSPFVKNLVANPLTIHFIHRGAAYLLLVIIGVWWYRGRSLNSNGLFSKLRHSLLLLTFLQVLLGILTVLNATYPDRLVLLGVSHQAVAMFLLMVIVSLLFIVRKRQ
jgi:cytochrome c oxidase assembly protein subunit 15